MHFNSLHLCLEPRTTGRREWKARTFHNHIFVILPSFWHSFRSFLQMWHRWFCNRHFDDYIELDDKFLRWKSTMTTTTSSSSTEQRNIFDFMTNSWCCLFARFYTVIKRGTNEIDKIQTVSHAYGHFVSPGGSHFEPATLQTSENSHSYSCVCAHSHANLWWEQLIRLIA